MSYTDGLGESMHIQEPVRESNWDLYQRAMKMGTENVRGKHGIRA